MLKIIHNKYVSSLNKAVIIKYISYQIEEIYQNIGISGDFEMKVFIHSRSC